MRRLAGVAAMAVMALGACTPGVQPTEQSRPTVDLGPERLQLTAALESFDDCDDVLAYFKDSAADAGNAVLYGGGFGIGGAFSGTAAMTQSALQPRELSAEAAGDDTAGSNRAASAPTTAAVGDGDFSTTNVQEAGVDEPDIVKTDGKRIVAVARGRLFVVDATAEAPVIRGSLALDNEYGYGGELFLAGDRVLLLTNGFRPDEPSQPSEPSEPSSQPSSQPPSERDASDAVASEPALIGPGGRQVAVLSSIDISDAAAPVVEKRVELDGEYVSARMVDGVARVVLRSAPNLRIQPLRGEFNAQRVKEHVEAAVAESELTDWLPAAHTSDGAAQPLVECDKVARPPEFSGVGTVSVVTVDTGKALEVSDAASVIADVQTVYASPKSLYVATNRWIDVASLQQQAAEGDLPSGEMPFITTELHKFDISDPARTVYKASGRVRGELLNQWSLSEHDGLLRAATTDIPQWLGDVAPTDEQQSYVTVLDEDAGALVRIGQVGGLGRNERIYAVRYFGPTAYVVTFRQTDPLYVVDLSDPRQPKVAGELKILGYSAYLHPVGEGLLLGVGQDATEEGRRLGTQLSLFDVSDPANPRRLHQARLAGGNSTVEFDHRAFLWWPAERLTVIPVEVYDSGPLRAPIEDAEPGRPADDRAVVEPVAPDAPSRVQQPFMGAVGFTVDSAAGFGERGRISHAARSQSDPYATPVVRSVVIRGTLYTLSEAGLLASDLATFADQGWAGF